MGVVPFFAKVDLGPKQQMFRNAHAVFGWLAGSRTHIAAAPPDMRNTIFAMLPQVYSAEQVLHIHENVMQYCCETERIFGVSGSMLMGLARTNSNLARVALQSNMHDLDDMHCLMRKFGSMKLGGACATDDDDDDVAILLDMADHVYCAAEVVKLVNYMP